MYNFSLIIKLDSASTNEIYCKQQASNLASALEKLKVALSLSADPVVVKIVYVQEVLENE